MWPARCKTARSLRQSIALLLAASACAATGAANAQSAADPFKIFLSDQFSYEDNLFRLDDLRLSGTPEDVGIESFDDYVNRLSGGIQARIDASKQVFSLDLRFDDLRYQENDELDFRGGMGDLRWAFDIGTRWSGRVDARYDRTQAGFSNYELFVRDVLTTQSYLGELRFKIGSRWALLGSGGISETEHSAPERKTSDFESETARGGVEYLTPAGSMVALEYAYTDATFPVAERLTGREVGFEQSMPGFRARYVISEKTRIDARGGYITRDYSNPLSRDYSGNMWSVGAYWEPRKQIYFDARVYQELKAYSDAESDYFVAQGVSITPTWAPTPLLSFALTLTSEDQSYRTRATFVPSDPEADVVGREDDVQSAALTMDYQPRNFLNFALTYRWGERESNRFLRNNTAEVASAQIRVIF